MFNLAVRTAVQSNSKLFFMPFFYQQNINDTTHLAIWAIREPLSFFEEGMQLAVPIQNEEKRIQHLAVRVLFKLMMPEIDLADLILADNGKPYLKGVPFHFSFSHCKGYAACAVCDKSPIGIDIEIIDAQSLLPFDRNQDVLKSVKKTNRLVVVEEAWPLASISSEISHIVQRRAFDYLDAPVHRVTSMDTNLPYASTFVEAYLPNVERIVKAVK